MNQEILFYPGILIVEVVHAGLDGEDIGEVKIYCWNGLYSVDLGSKKSSEQE